MSLTAADVRRIVREELAARQAASRPVIDPAAVAAALREYRAAIYPRPLFEPPDAHLQAAQADSDPVRQEVEDLGCVGTADSVDRVDELPGHPEFCRDCAVEEEVVVHGEPPCGCGDDTVGGPDPGDPSGSGSGPTGGAS